MIIREYQNYDYDTVLALWDEAKLPYKPRGRDSIERIGSELQNSTSMFLVAEINGKVVGFMLGEIKTYGFGVANSGWIEVIGVHPRHMGSGIGKKLGNELVKTFKKKKVKHIFTSVRWDSGDLVAFFKSIGFDRSDLINLERKIK